MNVEQAKNAGNASYLIPISMKGLRQGDIYEKLKFSYATSPRNTVRAFKDVGIIITGLPDLEMLAELHNSGMDVAGFTGPNGEIYAFNVEEILNRPPTHPKAIKVTGRMVAGAPIKWTDLVAHRGQVKIVNNS